MADDLIIYTPMYVTFFWALILFISPSKNRAKKFLGIFMVFAFLVYLSHAFFFNQNEGAYVIFDSIYLLASLSVYPLYFWYIKLLTVETDYNLTNIKLLLPGIILALSSILVYLLMHPNERLTYIEGYLFKKDIYMQETSLICIQRIIFIVSRLVFAIQVIYFLFAGHKLVLRYNQRIANFYSNLESKTIVWVRLLLISFVVTSIMSIAFNLVGRELFLHSSVLLLVPSIVFSVLLFFIGFQGYMQNHTVYDLITDESLPHEIKIRNYNQSQLREQLLKLFKDKKIYKNPDLKITQVSELLQTNRTYVSNIINNDFSSSFSDFVNGYRIEEAKNMLSDDYLKNYSMNYISEAVGFGSINTFIRVFKEHEKVTPGRFREIQKMNQKK